jgi:phospholipase/carboxylesterase
VSVPANGAPLVTAERAAAGVPEGLLVLHHGRATSEADLLGLGDALDPGRRLRVVAPRGPLQIAGWPGYHWYLVPRVGHPDPETFFASRQALAALQDRLWEETGVGPERTLLGGFSMGAVMSHALGWSGDRPAVAGVLAFSGFVPTVPGWQPSLADRPSTRAFVAHGDRDPVIGVELGRAARDLLEQGGIDVTYVESEAGHQIDPATLARASAWTAETLGL